MNKNSVAVGFLVLLFVGCSGRRERDEYMAVYEAADTAYQSGTILAAESAQLTLLEYSLVAYEDEANYIESIKVIILAHMRLWNIYTEMGESEKARFHIQESYDWAGEETDGRSLDEWTEDVAELFRQVDENVKPNWKRSNKPSEVTPEGAPPL